MRAVGAITNFAKKVHKFKHFIFSKFIVAAGFWAPLGSSVPKPCPEMGFYCPGALFDTVNDVGGSEPIIMPVGQSTTTRRRLLRR